MSFTEKDIKNLIKKPNSFLAQFHCARVMLEEAPNTILSFYENNRDKIDGDLIIVRTKEDESKAAHARNTSDKVFFVFSDKYYVSSYFSSVCARFTLSNALINRATKDEI